MERLLLISEFNSIRNLSTLGGIFLKRKYFILPNYSGSYPTRRSLGFYNSSIFHLLFSILFVFLFSSTIHAAQLTVAWDASSGAAGYKVYYGTAPRSYGNSIDVGNVTQRTLTGLTAGQRYYIAATTYDSSGNESTYSSEVSATAPASTSNPGVLAVTSSAGMSSSGRVGGPFSPASQTYTLQNTGGSSINWTASKGRSWVTLSASSGTLAAGGSASVTVSINSSANSLSAGSYSDTVTFQNTTNGGGNTSRSVSLAVSSSGVAYTLTTQPAGLQVTVDGTNYTTPRTFSWTSGSSHTISVSSPQAGVSGTRYVFGTWSDGRSQTHSITAPSNSATYTANFTTQYSLTMGVSPANGGGVAPSGTNWYSSGQSVTITATANTGYNFVQWTGSATGTSRSMSITMNGSKSIMANFATTSGTVSSAPGNIGIFRGGSWYLDGNGNGAFDGCGVDICINSFGGYSQDLPVVGDWTGTGTAKVGIYRGGQWYLDANGNGVWDGCRVETCITGVGGQSSDIPVIW